MVFDLVRPLGAKRGELEVNALAQQNLSGPDRTTNGDYHQAGQCPAMMSDTSAFAFRILVLPGRTATEPSEEVPCPAASRWRFNWGGRVSDVA
jgi:hypothetical protein